MPGYCYILIYADKTAWRANSSAGRAPALQAGGHRFEPCFAHHVFFPFIVWLEVNQVCKRKWEWAGSFKLSDTSI